MKIAALLVLVGCGVEATPADDAQRIELGRQLFYDERLSINGTQSCASCHRQELAFTDGKAVSIGATGQRGRRSAMSLVDVGLSPAFTWDGRARTLEEQALLPMFGDAPVELGLDHAFVLDGYDVDVITDALAAFQRTIVSTESRLDRGQLTPQEEQGRMLFESERLGCAGCHTGHDDVYFNTGLYFDDPDRGLADVTGNPEHRGRFKVPTLRNIAVTAPYMHDGSVATLDDVIDIYARGGRLIENGPHAGDGALNPRKAPQIRAFALTAEERAALLAFLQALTDDTLLASEAYANPWR